MPGRKVHRYLLPRRDVDIDRRDGAHRLAAGNSYQIVAMGTEVNLADNGADGTVGRINGRRVQKHDIVMADGYGGLPRCGETATVATQDEAARGPDPVIAQPHPLEDVRTANEARDEFGLRPLIDVF